METSDGYTCVIHRAKNTPNFPDHAAFPGGFAEPRNVLRKVCDMINEVQKNQNEDSKSLDRLCSFPRIEMAFMTEIMRELWSVREMTEEIGVKAKQKSPSGGGAATGNDKDNNNRSTPKSDNPTPKSDNPTPMSVNTTGTTDSQFIVEAETRCLGLIMRADYMPLVIMHVFFPNLNQVDLEAAYEVNRHEDKAETTHIDIVGLRGITVEGNSKGTQ
jgi:hypothetical protein